MKNALWIWGKKKLQRGLTRKGSQRGGEKKINSSIDNKTDNNSLVPTSSPRGDHHCLKLLEIFLIRHWWAYYCMKRKKMISILYQLTAFHFLLYVCRGESFFSTKWIHSRAFRLKNETHVSKNKYLESSYKIYTYFLGWSFISLINKYWLQCVVILIPFCSQACFFA